MGLISSNTFRWNSSQRVKVAGAYLAILRRLPTAGALADWEARSWAGAPLSDLTGSLFRSATYAARF